MTDTSDTTRKRNEHGGETIHSTAPSRRVRKYPTHIPSMAARPALGNGSGETRGGVSVPNAVGIRGCIPEAGRGHDAMAPKTAGWALFGGHRWGAVRHRRPVGVRRVRGSEPLGRKHRFLGEKNCFRNGMSPDGSQTTYILGGVRTTGSTKSYC